MDILQEQRPATETPTSRSSAEGAHGKLSRLASLAFTVFLILAALYCRLRLLPVPLERDEGGFAYVAQQLLHGIPPFDSGYSMKLPGIHAAYALFLAAMGETPTAIHVGLLLVSLGNLAVLYCLARRLLPEDAAIISAGVYALLSVSEDFMGVFAHATHFVSFFALAGMLTFLIWQDDQRPMLLPLSGLCLGMSVIMKQNGVFFALLVLMLLINVLWRQRVAPRDGLKRVALWGLGLAIPYALLLLYMAVNGVLAPFWFWTVIYSYAYAGGATLAEAIVSFRYGLLDATRTTLPLWGLALIGLVAAGARGGLLRNRCFLLLFAAVSLLATMPGGNFYPHYFVLLLPALALLTGAGFITLTRIIGLATGRNMAPLGALLIVALACTVVISRGRAYLFQLGPVEVSRFVYGENPFAEASMEIARFIRANSSRSDRIAILGSEPQIYFYAGRQSASRYLFVYSLMEDQPFAAAMRREMTAEIMANNPRFIVVSLQPSSWNVDHHSILTLLEPLTTYFKSNYTRVGIVDILPYGEVSYCWGEQAERAAALTPFPIYVFARNDGA